MLKNPLTYEIMTPHSVGVPDSRLVLGKHSGRHALALRCEQLGHQFNRHELDDVYRKFVVLADRIKKVQDSHLLELIQEVCTQGKRIPPATASAPFTRAAAAVSGSHEIPLPFPAPAPANSGPISVPVSFADHHAEQEDYLWGV
jgi:isopropylmalate/homocitrate/citramalate synthase